MTDDLIDRLSRNLRPAPRGAVARRLALAVALGLAVSLAGVALSLGLRPDFSLAMTSRMFWMKLAYAGGYAAVGVFCVERLARPVGAAGGRLRWLAVPVILIAVLAVLQMARTPAPEMRAMVMGHSAMVCPWFIAATSAPLLVALIWAVRGLAPTQLRLAGALLGLTAGGFGALIYCLHCPEVGAPFVAIWYSLGMLIPCAIGALVGPRLLRW
ncbi:MAG TPA: DUF1109 domain-containing protein [Caulobacteraceae bacterium]|nr:DUF1109 domain-containing protein [Caulobacteraceae bacterium]